MTPGKNTTRYLERRAYCLRCNDLVDESSGEETCRCGTTTLPQDHFLWDERRDSIDLGIIEPPSASVVRPVRMFFFSDWHNGNLESLSGRADRLEVLRARIEEAKADVVICAGDFADYGTIDSKFYDVLAWYALAASREKRQGFASGAKSAHVGFILGNHEGISHRRDLALGVDAFDLAFNLTYLGNGVLLYGLDAFEQTDFPIRRPLFIPRSILDLFIDRVNRHPARKKIMVSHEPPAEYIPVGAKGPHFGHPGISILAQGTQPDLIIYGHYHTGRGGEPGEPHRVAMKFGKKMTETINVGPQGVILEV